MSKEFPQFNEDEPAKAEGSARVKRPITPRTKKVVAGRASKKVHEPKQKIAEVVKAPKAEAKVYVVEKETPTPVAASSAAEPEWAEVAPELVGGASPVSEGGSKRKRRRRKGKGGGSPAASVEGAEGTASPVSAPQVKGRVDTEALAKSAWKIYLAEISEEGVALVGDQDARELAKRCFRLAEIFLDEQGRRRGGGL